jgi:hypothetical protein
MRRYELNSDSRILAKWAAKASSRVYSKIEQPLGAIFGLANVALVSLVFWAMLGYLIFVASRH